MKLGKIDKLKVELYLELLQTGNDNLTDSEIDIAFALSKDSCIQNILRNAIKERKNE